ASRHASVPSNRVTNSSRNTTADASATAAAMTELARPGRPAHGAAQVVLFGFPPREPHPAFRANPAALASTSALSAFSQENDPSGPGILPKCPCRAVCL